MSALGFVLYCSRWAHQNAAEAATIRVVIHLILAIFGKVPDLYAIYLNYSLFYGSTDDALMEYRIHRIGKKCHYIYTHMAFTFLQ